jgi:intergrase/recombinase
MENDEYHNINSNSTKNQQNEVLPNTVRTLPNRVRLSLPTNRSTKLSYQGIHPTHNLDNKFWNSFEEYLKNNYRKSSVKPRFLYARQYHQVLLEENAKYLVVLPNDKRLQVMKSLSVLSKFMGCYDNWKDIKERYQLKWSNENSVDTFKKIINEDNSFNSLLEWLKNTSSQISESHRNLLFYCTLTGLRPDEACHSIRLVKENINNYIDRDKMILKHFEFPDIFIRRTKQTYVSVANDLILTVANDSGNHSYNALRCHLRRKNISMNMNYCRKIFATFMRNNGVQSEIVDLLQGRIPKSVFVRHYYLLTKDYNKDVISPLLYRLNDVITR